MNHWASFLSFLCAPLAAGCIQSFDAGVTGGAGLQNSMTTADGASTQRPPAGSGGSGQGSGGSGQDGGGRSAGGDGGGTALPVCQNGNIIDPNSRPVYCVDNQPSGQIIVTQTPGIQLPDGSTSINPCDLTTSQSLVIRQTYCAVCHEGNSNPMAPFHNILDDADGGLLRTLSITTKDTAGNFVPLVTPGSPETSYLYQRVLTGSMPPAPASVAVAPLPRPNISEISILYSWIDNCLAAPPATDAGSPADAGGGG